MTRTAYYDKVIIVRHYADKIGRFTFVASVPDLPLSLSPGPPADDRSPAIYLRWSLAPRAKIFSRLAAAFQLETDASPETHASDVRRRFSGPGHNAENVSRCSKYFRAYAASPAESDESPEASPDRLGAESRPHARAENEEDTRSRGTNLSCASSPRASGER